MFLFRAPGFPDFTRAPEGRTTSNVRGDPGIGSRNGGGSGMGCIFGSEEWVTPHQRPSQNETSSLPRPRRFAAAGLGLVAAPSPPRSRPSLCPLPPPGLSLVHNRTCGLQDENPAPLESLRMCEKTVAHARGPRRRRWGKDCDRPKGHLLATPLAPHPRSARVNAL